MDRYNKYQTKQCTHTLPHCTHTRWWLVLGWVTTKEDHPRLRIACISYIWRVIKFYITLHYITSPASKNDFTGYPSVLEAIETMFFSGGVLAVWSLIQVIHQLDLKKMTSLVTLMCWIANEIMFFHNACWPVTYSSPASKR